MKEGGKGGGGHDGLDEMVTVLFKKKNTFREGGIRFTLLHLRRRVHE